MKSYKIIFFIIGGIMGLFISLWEAMVSHADTVPVDAPIGLDIPDARFFVQKTIIYLLLGGGTGFLLGILISFIKKRKAKWNFEK